MSAVDLELRHCACALLTRRDRVLLGRRSRERRYRGGLWDLIGGHLEAGETPEDALLREIEEELGVKPTRLKGLGSLSEPRPEVNGAHLYHLFHVEAWSGGNPAMRGREHSEIGWFTLGQILRLDLALAAYRPIFRRLLAAQANSR